MFVIIIIIIVFKRVCSKQIKVTISMCVIIIIIIMIINNFNVYFMHRNDRKYILSAKVSGQYVQLVCIHIPHWSHWTQSTVSLIALSFSSILDYFYTVLVVQERALLVLALMLSFLL